MKRSDKVLYSKARGVHIPHFCGNKKWWGYRLTLNLKSLNENIEHIHFKMHCLKEILQMVEKNCFIASSFFRYKICLLFNSSWWEFTKIFTIHMERTTILVLCLPKWTFTMSHMNYKAIETTSSRAEEIKTWYICIYWWCLSSKWHQRKIHQKYYRYCHTIKVFGVYRSCRKTIIFYQHKSLIF